MYHVYIIECRDSTLYTGITNDVERRIDEHTRGVGGRYTRAKGIKRLLYSEQHPDRSAASKREAAIKRLTRTQKLDLIRAAKKVPKD